MAITDVAPRSDSLEPGSAVEVRTRLDNRRWARGFQVDAVVDGRYRLRRSSDGEVLPALFDPDDVRAERKRGQWWY